MGKYRLNKYIKTDEHLHQLSQILAKVGRSYVAPVQDDGHTNMSFDVDTGRITGRPVKTPFGKKSLTLNIHNQCFEWLDENKNVVHTVSTIGKKNTAIEAEIETI